MYKWLSLIGFLGTIPAANWLISNVGTECIPDGPCLIPVAPGIMAPSGVLMIGLALVLRDLVQQSLGRWWAIGAIITGSTLALLVAVPELALASGLAFLLAESADMSVYTPLRERGRIVLAVLLSGVVGSIVDSIVFLWIAFGNLDFVTGQVIGKMYMSILAIPIIYMFSRRNLNDRYR